MKYAALAGFLALSGLLAASCSAPTDADPYSQVASHCMTQDPMMGQYLGATPDLLINTYLTPECKTALEAVIPYDNDSFATAPTGMKDKVTEAFQAIIAYPLAVDVNDSKYLGTSPAIAGAIPLFFTDIYQEFPNPNQSLFNYILNHTDSIYYGGEMDGTDAQYGPALSSQLRRITIYKDYWDLSNSFEGFRDPFVRASTLAHEARHGDTIVHETCNPDVTLGNSGFACDSELAGAYGMGGVYLKYLLHGSGTCSTPGCTPALPNMNVLIAGYNMCIVARYNENHRYAELDALVSPMTCGEVTYDWTMQHEGIPYPPPASTPSPDSAGVAAEQQRAITTYGKPHTTRCHYH